MVQRFILNEVSYFGPGAREVLPKEISRLGYKKAFVATDKDLIKFGVAEKVLKVLDAAGIPYEVFSDIKPNPTVANVKAGVAAFAASGADFIKTSTGFSTAGATKEDVALFAKHVGAGVQIKAAGGISSLDDAEEFINLGASRLGTSRIVKIAKEME